MDRMSSNHTLIATGKQPTNNHKAQRPLQRPLQRSLKTAQPLPQVPMKPSLSKNFSERLTSLEVPHLQPVVSNQWPISSLQSRRATPFSVKSSPRLSESRNMTTPVKEFIRLWQQITETKAIKIFIGKILSPNTRLSSF